MKIQLLFCVCLWLSDVVGLFASENNNYASLRRNVLGSCRSCKKKPVMLDQHNYCMACVKGYQDDKFHGEVSEKFEPDLACKQVRDAYYQQQDRKRIALKNKKIADVTSKQKDCWVGFLASFYCNDYDAKK